MIWQPCQQLMWAWPLEQQMLSLLLHSPPARALLQVSSAPHNIQGVHLNPQPSIQSAVSRAAAVVALLHVVVCYQVLAICSSCIGPVLAAQHERHIVPSQKNCAVVSGRLMHLLVQLCCPALTQPCCGPKRHLLTYVLVALVQDAAAA